MICDQVEKEFNAHKTEVALSANTINRYVRDGKFVVEYGFVTLTSDKMVHFSHEQRRRIAYVDETEVSLDGSTSLAGGRPSVHFYDPNLPLAITSRLRSRRPNAQAKYCCLRMHSISLPTSD